MAWAHALKNWRAIGLIRHVHQNQKTAGNKKNVETRQIVIGIGSKVCEEKWRWGSSFVFILHITIPEMHHNNVSE